MLSSFLTPKPHFRHRVVQLCMGLCKLGVKRWIFEGKIYYSSRAENTLSKFFPIESWQFIGKANCNFIAKYCCYAAHFNNRPFPPSEFAYISRSHAPASSKNPLNLLKAETPLNFSLFALRWHFPLCCDLTKITKALEFKLLPEVSTLGKETTNAIQATLSAYFLNFWRIVAVDGFIS